MTYSPHPWEIQKQVSMQVVSLPVSQTNPGAMVAKGSPGPPDPAQWLLLPDMKQQKVILSPIVPWIERHSGTTRGPFFSHKVVMCSRQKPNLGCFGPKETFTTKLYTSENKWAFILEGNPAGLFIICTTIIKLVLISAVECHWVGQVAGSVVGVGTISPCRKHSGK